MSGKLKIYACSGIGSTANTVAQNIENAGWMRNETLRKYLGTSKDGGCAEYFLYTFIPEREIGQYSYAIYKKRAMQLKTLEYVRELFVGHQYGSDSDLISIIRNGIEKTFSTSVENVLTGIRTGKIEGVGAALSVTAIISIITAVLSFVASIVAGILEYCKSVNVAKYTAPSLEEIEASTPAATDFTKNTKNSVGVFALIAGAALLLWGSIKK